MLSKKKQKNNTWAKRMAQYQLRRIYLETGASIPFTPDFFQNITTMLQSPAAAISSFNNIASLIEVWNIFEEIESGKYTLVDHYDRTDLTAYYGAQIASKAATVLVSGSTASYSDGVLTISGEPKLAAPSVLQENGIIGIEQW